MFYFYILENEEGELYYGASNDLRRRLGEHQNNHSKSTRHHDWQLIYYEAYRSESDARRREKQIKQHGQAKRQVRDRISDSRRK